MLHTSPLTYKCVVLHDEYKEKIHDMFYNSATCSIPIFIQTIRNNKRLMRCTGVQSKSSYQVALSPVDTLLQKAKILDAWKQDSKDHDRNAANGIEGRNSSVQDERVEFELDQSLTTEVPKQKADHLSPFTGIARQVV